MDDPKTQHTSEAADSASEFLAFSILRRPDGIFALGLRRRGLFENPEPDTAPRELAQYEPIVPLYDEELICLTAAHAEKQWDGAANFRELISAWNTLANVQEFDLETCTAIECVLGESTADPSNDQSIQYPLLVDSPPPKHKPTAANPRAYKGTKDRPPKPRRKPAIDLRPFLSTRDGIQRVLAKLSKVGLSTKEPADLRESPAGFQRYFSYLLRNHPKEVRSGVLRSYWELDLDRAPQLRALLARLVTYSKFETWINRLVEIIPERRVDFVDLLLNVRSSLPKPPPRGVLQKIDALSPEPHYRHRAFYFLDMLCFDENIDDVIAGFQLANRYKPANEFYALPPDAACIAAITGFMRDVKLDQLKDSWSRSGFPLWLWKACSGRPELAALIPLLPWKSLAQDAALELIRQLVLFEDHDVSEEDEMWRWNEMRSVVDDFLDGILSCEPAYQEKAVDLFGEGVWDEELEGGEMESGLRFLLACIPKVCGPPHAKQNAVYAPLYAFTELSPELQEQLLAAPKQSFRALDGASGRKNTADLIAMGFFAIAPELPEFLVRCFTNCAKALIEAANAIGLLSRPDRGQVLASFQKEPLFIDPATQDVSTLIELLDARPQTRITNPVSPRLRAHLKSELELAPGQISRFTVKIHNAWDNILCEQLEEAALDLLRSRIGFEREHMDSDEVRHAVKLYAGVEEQRPSLRRLIVECVSGNGKRKNLHPANQHWLDRHPRINSNVWTKGIDFQRELNGKHVVLTIENNPLEALRLGTHVGSCLGIGGQFTYSAAAIVLDINKQVIFARSSAGHFIARQVIAIAEDDSLACFDVYPLSTSDELCQLFAEYDHLLAAELGVGLTQDHVEDTSGNDDSDIANIVSTDWYDDSIWDLPKTRKSRKGLKKQG